MELITFLRLIPVPSAVGAVVYLLFRKVRPNPAYLWPLWIYYLICISTPSGYFLDNLILLLAGALMSIIGSWAHQKSIKPHESSPAPSYYLILGATLISTMVGAFITPVFDAFPSFSLWVNLMGSPVEWTVYFLLLSASTSLSPFLIWVWQSLKQQPGADKHFGS